MIDQETLYAIIGNPVITGLADNSGNIKIEDRNNKADIEGISYVIRYLNIYNIPDVIDDISHKYPGLPKILFITVPVDTGILGNHICMESGLQEQLCDLLENDTVIYLMLRSCFFDSDKKATHVKGEDSELTDRTIVVKVTRIEVKIDAEGTIQTFICVNRIFRKMDPKNVILNLTNTIDPRSDLYHKTRADLSYNKKAVNNTVRDAVARQDELEKAKECWENTQRLKKEFLRWIDNNTGYNSYLSDFTDPDIESAYDDPLGSRKKDLFSEYDMYKGKIHDLNEECKTIGTLENNKMHDLDIRLFADSKNLERILRQFRHYKSISRNMQGKHPFGIEYHDMSDIISKYISNMSRTIDSEQKQK